MPSRLLLAVFVAILVYTATPVRAEEIVTLSTRTGVTQSYLLTLPPQDKPAAAAVLFPGGSGAISLRDSNGQIEFNSTNFLVRSRQFFADAGIATAVVDAPSDSRSGMSDAVRLGSDHARDVGAIVDDLTRRFGVPVFLVGTSRGTISAASTGRALGNRVAGVVLTSSVFLSSHKGPGLVSFDFSTIAAPLLFVHNVDDACPVTPYGAAQALSNRFPLITVHGGDPPQSDACEALSYHGYLGRERATVEAIANWILKKPYRSDIE